MKLLYQTALYRYSTLAPLDFEYLALPQVYTFFRWRLYGKTNFNYKFIIIPRIDREYLTPIAMSMSQFHKFKSAVKSVVDISKEQTWCNQIIYEASSLPNFVSLQLYDTTPMLCYGHLIHDRQTDTITFGKRLPFWAPLTDLDKLIEEKELYKNFFTGKIPLTIIPGVQGINPFDELTTVWYRGDNLTARTLANLNRVAGFQDCNESKGMIV